MQLGEDAGDDDAFILDQDKEVDYRGVGDQDEEDDDHAGEA